ncbi:Holo-[acyl-carrier-protein] synthase protein [Dioscorea alata]|uniref:Holo-[acyl-carrier-protein] synthase protein n=1 Tax=Dioscorea alata TaxID=55571 RepID=A0ACB7TVT0_DIOAL|nr:Holo-[acyl-carrier-protein] synthase protein [Dioscorea alata]
MEQPVRRWLVDISGWNPSEDEFSSLVSLLPQHEHSAISRFIKFEDRKRAYVSRLLQYSLVHEVLGIHFHKIIINRTIEGKPYLKNGQDMLMNFNFNVSHHGNYVGIVSEPVCPVGLDIVSIHIPRHEPALELVKNFSSYFTNLEWGKIMNAGSSDDIFSDFLRCWSLKEAFVKALGAGLGYGLHRLEFHHNNWTHISVYIDGMKSTEWRFWHFKIDNLHFATVAKGPPGASESNQRTLMQVATKEELNTIHPHDQFIFRTVEDLISVFLREKGLADEFNLL